MNVRSWLTLGVLNLSHELVTFSLTLAQSAGPLRGAPSIQLNNVSLDELVVQVQQTPPVELPLKMNEHAVPSGELPTASARVQRLPTREKFGCDSDIREFWRKLLN